MSRFGWDPNQMIEGGVEGSVDIDTGQIDIGTGQINIHGQIVGSGRPPPPPPGPIDQAIAYAKANPLLVGGGLIAAYLLWRR